MNHWIRAWVRCGMFAPLVAGCAGSAEKGTVADSQDTGCGAETPLWFPDGDGDGFGVEAGSVTACEAPAGYVTRATDCDDDDASVYPAAVEVCGDGVVNDCDSDAAAAADDCSVVGTSDLSTADAKLLGVGGEDNAGNAVAAAGDVNADGHDDLLVCAFNEDATLGRVLLDVGAAHVVLGPVSGSVSLADADATFLGDSEYAFACTSASSAQDVDGDGYDDLLIGAPGAFLHDLGGGVAYLVFGPVSGDGLVSEAGAQWAGESDTAQVGTSLSGAGDVDGDGLGDLLVGAPASFGAESGVAYVLTGSFGGPAELKDATAKLVAEADDDEAAASVAGVGDVDGDGLDDLLIGAYLQDAGGDASGAAYLVLGPASGEQTLSSADAMLIGEAAVDEAGSVVARAGDVNGDGYKDVLVRACCQDTGGENAGAVYLVAGPFSGMQSLASATAKLTGDQPNGAVGASVSGAGDIDGDGFEDVLVGESWSMANTGAACLVHGPFEGVRALSTADAIRTGEREGDRAGSGVAGVGDVDGDGFADLLIGADSEDTTREDAGAAYLILGGAGVW